jgi:hypothetical protein
MRELGKWPRLLVAGEPVRPEQADEILVRTNCWYTPTNDRAFAKMVAELAGISIGQHGLFEAASLRRFEERHHVLRLQYLHNWRVCSAWIDGPRGWVDWTGTVGCATWNIGKWPSVAAVTEDWQQVAEAFPFLNLTAQLVADTSVDSDDPGEGVAVRPAVQWQVRGGAVEVDPDPTDVVRRIEEIDFGAVAESLRSDPFRERGVGRERLDQAIQRIRANGASGSDPC